MAARTRALPHARSPIPATMRDPLILAATLVLALAVYAPTIGNQLIALIDPADPGVSSDPGKFLTSLSYAVNNGSPAAYHTTNLLLHLANIALVYFTVRALTARTFLAHFCAVAFAIHPLNVDAVASVAARSTLLATLFALGSLLAYARCLSRPRWWLLGVSVLLFGLAALSSWTAIGLPLVLALVDYLRARAWRRALLEKLPYVAVSVAAALFLAPDGVSYAGPFAVCSALVAYLVKLIVPGNLAMAYAYPAHLAWYAYLAPVALAALIAALYRVGRIGLFGLGFFAVLALPGVVVRLNDSYAANRHAYLAGVGLFLVVGHLLSLALRRPEAIAPGDPRRARPASQARDVRVPAIATGLLAGVVVVFAILAVLRGVTWHDTVRLTTASIATDPGLGSVYASRGAAEYVARDYPAAQRDFAKSVALDPGYALAYVYIGRMKHINGDFTGAVAEFDKAIELDPGMAVAYADRGRARNAQQDSVGALNDLSWAIGLDDHLAEAYHQRGILEIQVGNDKAAVRDFDQVIALLPNYADAYYYRGVAKSRLNDMGAACADLHKAQGLGQAKASETLSKSCVMG